MDDFTNYETIYNEFLKVKDLLDKPELSNDDITTINRFLDIYYKMYHNSLYSDDNKTREALQLCEIIMNSVNDSDLDDNKYPAVRIIREREQKNIAAIDEKMIKMRQLTPPNNTQAGFGTIILIVGSTIVLGVALGALLWFIR